MCEDSCENLLEILAVIIFATIRQFFKKTCFWGEKRQDPEPNKDLETRHKMLMKSPKTQYSAKILRLEFWKSSDANSEIGLLSPISCVCGSLQP